MPPLSSEAPRDKSQLSLKEKLDFFSQGIPLLIPYGTKACKTREWEKITFADSQRPDYLTRLFSLECNVAIRQGGGVSVYAAFDFDTDDQGIRSEFARANPKAAASLCTRGAKGCTLWLKMKGAFPQRVVKMNIRGHLVEWRANGYSLIHGRHPHGAFYEIVQAAKIVEIQWEELVCPGPDWARDWPTLHPRTPEAKSDSPEGEVEPAELARRRSFIESAYHVLEWHTPTKAFIECVNASAHTGDTGAGQTVLWITPRGDGTPPCYHCAHAHCAQTNKDETRRILNDFNSAAAIVLSNQSRPLEKQLEKLTRKLIACGSIFRENSLAPYQLFLFDEDKEKISLLTRSNLGELLARTGIWFAKFNKDNQLIETRPTIEQAKTILDWDGLELLPEAMRTPLETPTAIKTRDGVSLVTQGYCPPLKAIIIQGKNKLPEPPPIEVALKSIYRLLDFWPWKTSTDRTRALTELLTPALLAGEFISRPVPAFLVSASHHNSGKTFWHKAVHLVYGQEIDPCTFSKKNGINSINEHIDFALASGKSFCFIDELTGEVKSEEINSLITGGDTRTVRTAYCPFSEASTKRFLLMFAGNDGFKLDDQLASRVIPIRLEYRDGYSWQLEDGSPIENWIRGQSNTLLAAVYSVLMRWAELGYPVVENKSRFISWWMSINGILKSVFSLPPIEAGELSELQGELSNPAIDWFKQIRENSPEGLWYKGSGKPQALSASQFYTVLVRDSGLGVPGANLALRGDILERHQVILIGKLIARSKEIDTKKGHSVFKIEPDYFIFRYHCGNRENSRPNYKYALSTVSVMPDEFAYYEVVECIPEVQ